MTNHQKDELRLIIERLDQWYLLGFPNSNKVFIKQVLNQSMKNSIDATPLEYVQRGLGYKVLEWIDNGCPHSLTP